MHTDHMVFAESFLGGAFDWIKAGVSLTAAFLRDWIAGTFTSQIFGYITVAVVLIALFMRFLSNRQL
jgi:hypothetical protein